MQLRRLVAGCLALLAGLTAPGSCVLSAEAMFRFSETQSESPPSDFEGMIVDSIEIDNRNIYDTKQPGYSGFLFRAANRLHLVTRQRVVGRELLLEKGQAFSRDLAEETARNLRQRLPLNDAWVEVERLDDRRVLVRVVTIDQWSLQGGVRSFDRSGQETSLQVGVEDKNLLGQAQYLSLDYYVQESDNNYVTSTFREIRVLGRPLSLQLDFSSNPTARLKKLTFGRPFYNLAQTFSFQIETSDGGGRQERFYEGTQIAQWQAKYDATRLSADYRFGPYHRKTTVGASYLYVSNRTSDRVIDDPSLFVPGNFPGDSVYHRVGVGAAQSFAHYVVVNRINGFAYTEDMSVGTEFKASFGRAFVPGFRDYLHDLLKVSGLGTLRLGSLLVSGEYNRSLWFRQSVDLRRETQCGLRAYYNRFRFMTLALRTWYASDRGEDPNPLDLGGKNGLRGYATEFTSGDRLHVTNLEARFYTGVEILSLLLGGVVFTDIGRTWASGQPVVLRDYYQGFGAGLRVSLEKLSRTELIRADVAITPDGRWELLLGTGQYF
jgi:outer membrane protein assembly factor BamA